MFISSQWMNDCFTFLSYYYVLAMMAFINVACIEMLLSSIIANNDICVLYQMAHGTPSSGARPVGHSNMKNIARLDNYNVMQLRW